MGMAASQARYLALVARKSNCEYQGQQINQSRLNLSNQSANLFNQMLGLTVPTPPSTQDFTTTQYSFSDGYNEFTIDDWNQLSNADPEYNYVVKYHYNTDIYTGSEKLLADPQVQMTNVESKNPIAPLSEIENALIIKNTTAENYEIKKAEYEALKKDAETITNYSNSDYFTRIDKTKKITDPTAEGTNVWQFQYDVKGTRTTANFYGLNSVKDSGKGTGSTVPNLNKTDLDKIKDVLNDLMLNGALESQDITDMTLDELAVAFPDVYYDPNSESVAFSSDLKVLNGYLSNTRTYAVVYSNKAATTASGDTVHNIATAYNTELKTAYDAMQNALINRNEAQEAYDSLVKPTAIGNCPVTLLTELTEDQKAEIRQIAKDITYSDIANCFDVEADTYSGGIYKFDMNGQTYFTTYNNLVNAFPSIYEDKNNDIDLQVKLPYYNASYIDTKIESTTKALLETDKNGRFKTVKFEDSSVVYTLNFETITDDAAYQDAMNQYYYENNKYDKMVQDINAKTSLIHQEDQQLELKLKQLETEQNALKTEIDAVQGIVKDNVEKSFKTFS